MNWVLQFKNPKFSVRFFLHLLMGLRFAGGAMTWMVFAELIPDAIEDTKKLP